MAADSKPSIHRNRILAALSVGDMALLEARLERVPLDLRQVLEAPHRPIEAVYFIERGIASVVAVTPTHKRIEAGIIGREGMSGLAVVMGDSSSPHETYMQVKGAGARIQSADLKTAIGSSSSLHTMLLRFGQAFMYQTAHTALANGQAKIEERLARWLLMAHDRIDGDDVPLVHDFLALMLGVRRPGVTVALHALETRGLIRTSRGVVAVADRAGLVQSANGYYGVPEAEYRRLIG